MSSSQEAVREREVLKYDGDYASRSIINLANSKQIPPVTIEPHRSTTVPSILSTATDSSLTSFAQLAAFRLDCRRALISLYDRHFQYIIAEATQNVPLQPAVEHEELWLCGTGIPRTHGICEHVLIAPQGDTLPVSVVPDLAEDPRFSDRHYIQHAPFNRFYAGVPIRSHRGINIGVLCIFDDKPHDGLDDNAIQYLRDLSRNIMNYLEGRRVLDVASRHERMVRGLGSFVEGDSHLSGLADVPSQRPDLQVNLPVAEDEESGSSFVRPDELQRQLLGEEANQLLRPALSEEARASSTCVLETAPPPRAADPGLVRSISDSRLKHGDAASAPPPNMTDAHGPSHFTEVKQVFAKAANIIRQAIDVEGVVFLDASIRSFGGLVDANNPAVAPDESLGSPSSSDESANLNSTRDRAYGSPFCDVLGFSAPQSSSLDRDPPDPGYSLVREKFLRTLLRRYPKGHIINFDSEGILLPGDSSSSDEDAAPELGLKRAETSENSGARIRPRQSWSSQIKFLLKIFPGVRSLAILPIWDASRERWYAGGFVYTTSSSRTFTTEVELGFLKTFGKAIQTELIQVETIFSEKAKSDALGSLSHELRSPLHGLLGACELLHDTRMSAFQSDMVRMAETSGRTLLDVIDHLLDYSKMSSTRNYPDQAQSSSRRSVQNLGFLDSSNQNLADIEVDLVVEEVVESVFTGYNFQKIAAAVPKRKDYSLLGATNTGKPLEKRSTERKAYKTLSDNDQVAVYLDIDHGYSWQMLAYPGAIRRIVMNLLGNSLKFTQEGFIFVSLKQEASSKSKRGADIVLTVIDSGCGISEDFLQHQLFKPFSQEDKLSPGTGLGLNVVKQIVNMLQGQIHVLSHPGLGTKSVVTIPLTYTSELTPSPGQFLPNIDILRGQSVLLLGFDKSLHTHFLSSRKMDEGLLLSRLCRDWCGMDLIKSTSWETGTEPDVLIANELSLSEIEESQNEGKITCPVVVVCHDSVTAHDLSVTAEQFGRSNLHFITQPIGPRKLAEAIVFSINQSKLHEASRMEPMPPQNQQAATETAEDLATPESITPSDVPSTDDLTTSSPVSVPSIELSPPSPATASEETTPTKLDSVENSAGDQSPIIPKTDVVTDEAKAILESKGLEPSGNETSSTLTSEKANSEELRFLVVDDNKINVQILSSFLKKLKKVHSTAMDGLEALETYTSSPGHFDYVFMDISMPRMDGLEATRRIRLFERENNLKRPAKIIALTGLVSESTREEAFASGIDMFFTKPVKLQQLKDLISQDEQSKSAAS